MKNIKIEDLAFQEVNITKAMEYDGYKIRFIINNQTFHFLVGSMKLPFALNVKHSFSKKETCHICEKTIYPVPLGHQLCSPLQKNMKDLLTYFQNTYSDCFKSALV